ncbi:MAG: YhhN family protein, partial [Deltaproteobacteria bacterium]|nr:YhhN family protein [Deltaproteobacteria bacterium]
MLLSVVAAIGCGVACGVLVFAESRGLARLRIAAKLVASAAFVTIGALALAGGSSAFTRWMFGGLVLGAIGDAALLGRSKRAFLAGLVAFLLGHLAYVVGIAQIEPVERWYADAGLTALLPLGAGALALAVLWRRLGSLRVPVILYVATIITMVIAALAANRGHALPWPRCLYLGVGATLFFASDLA